MSDNTVNRMSGCVKWFNNKSGFGFITVCSEISNKGSEIFVHYSAIRNSKTQYKYLVQGEYVDFNLVSNETGDHKFNADDVTGINGGLIMCESRQVAYTNTTNGKGDFSRESTQRESSPGESTQRESSPRESTQRESTQQDRKYKLKSQSTDGFQEVRKGYNPRSDVVASKNTKPQSSSSNSRTSSSAK